MLIKDTSLVSVIELVELLRAAQEIQSQTFNSSALIAAALIYLAICLPLNSVSCVAREPGTSQPVPVVPLSH